MELMRTYSSNGRVSVCCMAGTLHSAGSADKAPSVSHASHADVGLAFVHESAPHQHLPVDWRTAGRFPHGPGGCPKLCIESYQPTAAGGGRRVPR